MKETYASGVPYISGETVKGGDYECERCGRRLSIDEDKVTNLPVCPECQNDTWRAA